MAKKRQPKSILRLKVRGPHIKPGRIPIPELLAICQEAQNAINRQAEALMGRKSLKPGPVSADVAEECTLELFAIGRGSAVMSFAQPDPPPTAQTTFDLPIQTLSEEAVFNVVESIRSIHRNKIDLVETGVLRSFQTLSAILNNGVREIEWIIPRDGKRKRTVALFDQDIRDRVKAAPERSTQKPIEVDGILEMADFKASDLKCIVHTADDNRTPCSFSEEMADDVYSALRHATRVKGVGTFNARTKRLEHIELAAVRVLDPNLFDAQAFFAGQTLEDLARTQGVSPNSAIPSLSDVCTESDVDALIADIYSHRA